MHGLRCKCVNSNVRDFTVQEKKNESAKTPRDFFSF